MNGVCETFAAPAPERAPTLAGRFAAHDIVAAAGWPDRGRRRDPCRPPGVLRPGCAVVICTYRRPELVRGFLASLRQQPERPEQLIVVDASPDDQTEQVLQELGGGNGLAAVETRYFRVGGGLRGLTRQRNFALRHVDVDLVAFFDDDVVLLPGALAAMIGAHRAGGDAVVGAGALQERHRLSPKLAALWRVRRALGLVSSLRPGSYCRSGMYVPWAFLPEDTEGVCEGDWLPGYAMMWKTAAARCVGFNECFQGYANAEDVEFSMRLSRRGRIVVAGRARLLHLQDGGGRPDAAQMGYANIAGAYYIHRHCLARRTARDAAWFVYAHAVDTLARSVSLLRPHQARYTWQYLRGRLRFFRELMFVR